MPIAPGGESRLAHVHAHPMTPPCHMLCMWHTVHAGSAVVMLLAYVRAPAPACRMSHMNANVNACMSRRPPAAPPLKSPYAWLAPCAVLMPRIPSGAELAAMGALPVPALNTGEAVATVGPACRGVCMSHVQLCPPCRPNPSPPTPATRPHSCNLSFSMSSVHNQTRQYVPFP